MKSLKEDIQTLREFMNASSYPGPTPGQMRDLQLAYSPATRLMLFPGQTGDEIYGKQFKDKNKKKRDTLRKLAIWLRQKGEQ